MVAKEVETNIPVVSVSQFVNLYSKVIIGSVKKGLPISELHSVFLWGAPGVGKSKSIFELAKVIENATKKKVVVSDVRLLLMNPVDLHGIPVANKNKTSAVWLKPKMFDLDPSDDIINILFLDELSAASPSLQACAYQLVLDKKIGEHTLPANTIVIGAGNRVTDQSVAYRMPKALANRFSHFEVRSDIDSWHEWASNNDIHPYVLGYLSFDSGKLIVDGDSDGTAYPTPRTWEFVSDVLKIADGTDNLEEFYPIIASYIGNAVAGEFVSWIKRYKELPKIADIFAGKNPKVPSSPDAQYILCSSIITFANCKFRLKKIDDELENMAKYIAKLSADYTANIYMELLKNDEMHAVLKTCPSFNKWTKDHKSVYQQICKKY